MTDGKKKKYGIDSCQSGTTEFVNLQKCCRPQVLVLTFAVLLAALISLLGSTLRRISRVLSYLTDYCRHYQIADNQLDKIMDLLSVIRSLWSGMISLLVGMIGLNLRPWSWSWS